MSNIEQIDFSTLIWVKKELDETLNRAKNALEIYVENPEDENQLQFCATYLHQVQGTLKMVELYGAAMVAEEMEQVAKKILDKNVDSEKDAFEVLMRGIILLPDYLERIQLGYKDIPIVLLPLVNDLRTVKGDHLLSESSLFNPNLSRGLPDSEKLGDKNITQQQLEKAVAQIRPVYQICLLKFLKNQDVDNNLKKLELITGKLKSIVKHTHEKQLFWVAGGLFSALRSGELKNSVTIKQLIARLDQGIRQLVAKDKTGDSIYKTLTNNFLYYIGLASNKNTHVRLIQEFFKLSDFISDESEIEHAKSSLSGKNKELLESVSNVIKEDLLTIQENLDLFNRNADAKTSDMKPIAKSLDKISDTLGIIGVGSAKSKITKIVEKLETVIKSDEDVSKDLVMEVAETLLFVESSLDENIMSLGAEITENREQSSKNLISNTEVQKIMDVLATESINNLQKIKQNFVLFIEAPWNKETISETPKLLSDMSGALKMSGLVEVSDVIDQIENYTVDYMLKPNYKPSVDQLDLLAESIASIEYFLEYISNGTKGEVSILNLAKSNIKKLFELTDSIIEKETNATEVEQVTTHNTNNSTKLELVESNNKNETDEQVSTFEDDHSQDSIETNEENKTKEQSDDLPTKEPENNTNLIVSFSEETDEDIKEVFLEEFEEELESLTKNFSIWKQNPEQEIDLLGDIRRSYHTLKGSGRLVGALAIGDYSWKLEEMTNMALNKTIDITDSYIMVMQKSGEHLPKLLKCLQQETQVPDGYFEIIAAAQKVINGEEVVEADFISALDAKEIENPVEEINEEVDLIEKPEAESSTQETNNVTDDLSVDPVFIEILQQEVEGHLEDIDNYLLDVEKTNQSRATEKFIRVVHTLNGAANMASVHSIVEMTTPLEMVAKLSNELKKDFDSETLEKIKEFKTESGLVMQNLASNSASNENTSNIGEYFKELFEKLEQEKNNDETDEFDLSLFIDEPANITQDATLSTISIDSNFIDSTEIKEIEHEIEIDNDIELAVSNYDQSELEKEMEVDLDFEIDTGLILKDSQEKPDYEIESVHINMDEVEQENREEDKKVQEISIEEIDFDLDFGIDQEQDEDEIQEELSENVDSTQTEKQEQQDENQTEQDESKEEQLEVEEEVEIESQDKEQVEEEALEEQLEIEEETVEESQFETPDIAQIEVESQDEQLEIEQEAEIDPQDMEKVEEEVQEEQSEIKEQIISTSYGNKPVEDTADISSEFDEELIEIFKEEADEILDRTEHVLSDLEENPDDMTHILALQRDLHTLKGGARMAGLSNIGDLSHVLESLLENVGEENKAVDQSTLAVIHDSFDLLSNIKDQENFGQSADISEIIVRVKQHISKEGGDVIPEESKLDQDYLNQVETNDDDSNDASETTVKKKSNVLSGNQIKVNSELLDNLVNYAGEVSIYRSRLEQEIGSFGVNLSELGNTVARIKEQLRKLDVETEAQIISTFQSEMDDEGFDPLEMDRFSQLQQLSRSLAESVSDLTSIHSYLDDVARTSENLLMQQSRVNTELQEGLMETRLVSFNSIVPRLRRLVRTTSKELNKPVKLEVLGAEGEMDKTVLEGVIAPLEHMLRNALAHGIESDRHKNNKSEKGKIVIDVQREATEVVITVKDDGAGINREKVLSLAIEKGIVDKDERLSNENIDRLILNSGFSTVDVVSKLAGRGVGMDVVSNKINLLGGSLDISSVPNKGTEFNIRLPYTLALSSALLVEIAETVYAIPISGLEGIIRMSYSDYQSRKETNNTDYLYANEEYQIQELNNLLDLESEIVVENNQIPLVMIRSGKQGVALRVDRILGSREIVVKTVGSQISSVPGIFGATILGDGRVVLILDIIPLTRAYIYKMENLSDADLEAVEQDIEKDPIVMIVDDSITMRKVGERILRRNDYEVVTAKDGLDALDHLKEVVPDIMLLDIEMPRMDGYELAIEMKKNDKYKNIPIIMITSRTGEKHRQKAMDLGVDRYLGKPYQEANLLENISELIESNKN